MYLGKFSANTSIAFALIVNGWNVVNVTNTKGILYANAAFNPEKADSLKKHTVLLNDESTGKLIIGFEDTRRDDAQCDNDFNDVLFYATVNARSGTTEGSAAIVTSPAPIRCAACAARRAAPVIAVPPSTTACPPRIFVAILRRPGKMIDPKLWRICK